MIAPARSDLTGAAARARTPARALVLSAALAFSLVACSNAPSALPPSVPAAISKPDRSTASVVSTTPDSAFPVLSIEPWTAISPAGRVVRTPAYRLFTTMPPGVTLSRLPGFMETALAAYRSTYTTLPAPPLALDTFLLASRPQWMKLTSQMFPDEAEGFLKIPRGGFTLNARALLYDLGTRDTLALIGHEGWHQFTQQTFIDPLPIWLEEGIATHMEGYRWDAADPTRAVFTPWTNPERFDQLRRVSEQGRLFSLTELLSSSPQDLIAQNSSIRTGASGSSEAARDPQAALTYYAQVWTLVHFLNEGQNGRYRDKLAALITDAAEGRVVEAVRRTSGERAATAYATNRRGTGLFQLYFNADLDEAQRQYTAFIARITRVGGRDLIVAGRSPV